jgi:hypothetical protein
MKRTNEESISSILKEAPTVQSSFGRLIGAIIVLKAISHVRPRARIFLGLSVGGVLLFAAKLAWEAVRNGFWPHP